MILSKTQDASSHYSLILNTSGPQTQVGLCLGSQLIAAKEAEKPNDHTRDIISYIDDVLQSGGITLQQLAVIGVVVGPGSYTGIRIGIATAQGLSLPFKTKLLALSLLEALAFDGHKGEGTILFSTCKARNHMTYYQLFDQNLQPLMVPSVAKTDEMPQKIASCQAQYPNHSLIILSDNKGIGLTTLGQLAYHHREKGGQDLVPLYINQPEYRKTHD